MKTSTTSISDFGFGSGSKAMGSRAVISVSGCSSALLGTRMRGVTKGGIGHGMSAPRGKPGLPSVPEEWLEKIR